MPQSHVNGIMLAFDRTGTGTPLLLLHGGSGRRQTFEPLRRFLADDLEAYAVDLSGHGGSTHTPGRYRLEDAAADLSDFIRARVGRPAVVYGHSFGGHVALVLAARYPRAVRAVVIGDAPLSVASTCAAIERNRVTVTAFRELAAAGLERAELAMRLRVLFGNDSPWAEEAASLASHDPAFLDAVLEHCAEMHASLDENLLAKIECSVLLLQGDPQAGALLSSEEVQLARRVGRDIRSERLSGVGHGLHLDDPKGVADVINAFVRAVEPR